ncbi:MAG: exodeoxyribonuclease VII large subunit, partial [Lysobacteraceae bacterium]
AVLHASRPQRRLSLLRDRLQSLAPRPQAATVRALQRHALHLHGLARSLEAVSPLATVARGYAILQRDDGRIVRSVHDVRAGQHLDARLHDGRLKLRVENDD